MVGIGVTIEDAVLAVKRGKDMVAIDGNVVEVGRDILKEYRHRVTLARYGGVVHLAVVLVLTVGPEMIASVLLADEGTLASGNSL